MENLDIPKLYKPVYDKAVAGQSRSTGIKAFCLKCCLWQWKLVRLCTNSACPLFAYRPYKAVAPKRKAAPMIPEPTREALPPEPEKRPALPTASASDCWIV